MRNLKRLLIIVVVSLLGLSALAIAVGIVFTDLIVDFWWHQELGFSDFFWLKLLYRYILSGGVTLFFFLIFFLNFWAASRYLGVDAESFAGLGRLEGSRRQRILTLFQSGSMQVYVPLSLILAILIAIPFYQKWHSALLFIFGPDSGFKDPLFGHDASFYLFAFPVFLLIETKTLLATAVLTLSIALLYWLEHRISSGKGRRWAPGAKTHLSGLVVLTVLVLAWGFFLERFDLLFGETHEPQFFGPGFLEVHYYLPLIWLSILSVIVLTLAGLFYVHRRKGTATILISAALLAFSLGLQKIEAIPLAIDRFIVRPNPVKTEYRYMKNNIDATLTAYDLNGIISLNMDPGVIDEVALDSELRSHLYDIPVWDPEFLDDVYQQLQGIRPYYHFNNVDIARYMVNGRLEQVNLGAREVNIKNLPREAQNWENTHLRYTHGYGAVVTPAAQDGQTPISWFLRDLDMKQSDGFTIERPDIYFGEEQLPYAIVPNKLEITGIPSVDEVSSFNYSGNGGIPLSSLFRRLLVAIHLRDERLFFSVGVNKESRALIHRNIVDRVQTLTPFLRLDHDPYLVITPKRLFWIMDAYTTSDWYPLSKRSNARFNGEHGDRQINYIRNSVKVVIDAFDGSVDYYITDHGDPIIQGYRNAYPDLFKDISSLPPDLRIQLRYPSGMFSQQMLIYGRYHQEDPALFYEQAETWDFARVNDALVKPYYFTTALEGYESNQHNFILLNPMTPIGRSNLSALAVGGTFTTGPNEANTTYTKQIVVYRFERDTQVDGPAQVSALIDQDPVIARQLALWDQRSSRVLRGRIIVLPVGRSVIYVQPVYLVSTSGTRIPELQRIILSMGNVVVMSESLEEGIKELKERLRKVRETAPARPPAPLQLPSGPSMGPSS